MEAFYQSFVLVFVSEMGDKTQLLALVLALRFKKPWAVLSGILVATLANHGLASFFGSWIAEKISEHTLNLSLGLIFLAFAVWVLIPDKIDEEQSGSSNAGAFLTTTGLFFLAEMGDKTQLATVALGARFQQAFIVTLATTLGMLLANGLPVFFGDKLIKRIPMNWVRIFCSILFALFGIYLLLQII